MKRSVNLDQGHHLVVDEVADVKEPRVDVAVPVVLYGVLTHCDGRGAVNGHFRWSGGNPSQSYHEPAEGLDLSRGQVNSHEF